MRPAAGSCFGAIRRVASAYKCFPLFVPQSARGHPSGADGQRPPASRRPAVIKLQRRRRRSLGRGACLVTCWFPSPRRSASRKEDRVPTRRAARSPPCRPSFQTRRTAWCPAPSRPRAPPPAAPPPRPPVAFGHCEDNHGILPRAAASRGGPRAEGDGLSGRVRAAGCCARTCLVTVAKNEKELDSTNKRTSGREINPSPV